MTDIRLSSIRVVTCLRTSFPMKCDNATMSKNLIYATGQLSIRKIAGSLNKRTEGSRRIFPAGII